MPDGTTVNPFTIPPGKVLVLTVLVGAVRRDNPWTAGSFAVLRASFKGGSGTPSLEALTQIDADAVANGIVPVSVHSQSGVLGGSHATICLGPGVAGPGVYMAAYVERAYLQGY